MQLDWVDVLRTLLIYGHLLAFGISICLVLAEDWRLLNSNSINLAQLKITHASLTVTLLFLALTGGAIIGIDLT